MRVCIITDNIYIYDNFKKIIKEKNLSDVFFDFFCSTNNSSFEKAFDSSKIMTPINLKTVEDSFFDQYDLFISLHCKQIFPSKMVNEHLCINVHPGYNPYNRGWYPQVFGIMNKLPIGVTIHKMDDELDHGSILYQKEIAVERSETSKDIYMRLLQLEVELLEEHLEDILIGNYSLTPMDEDGNINSKKDFADLCMIDLNKTATYGEVIDYLRAMTFAPYNNAYFYDNDGKKVYVGIDLKKEK